MNKLVITVKEIKGHCPVYRIGNRIVLVDAKQLGLSKDGQRAYVQCLDPCHYTGGGTVVFEMERVVC